MPAGESVEPKWLRYSYYTAGSGGAGPTILETSFLLAGEDVIVYKDNKEVVLPPISNRREVDFGPGECTPGAGVEVAGRRRRPFAEAPDADSALGSVYRDLIISHH